MGGAGARAEGLAVVVVTGAPATGKSTLGRLLARRLQAALIDQDVATGPLVAVIQQLVGLDDLDDERLAGLTRTARYEVMTALAIDNLTAGRPVVLVAPYTAERADDQAWTRLAARFADAGGSPLLVWLSLEPDEIVRRLQARGAVRDREKLTDASTYRAKLAQRATAPVGPHLRLAADQSRHLLVQRVIDVLK
jgi:predicted kinase